MIGAASHGDGANGGGPGLGGSNVLDALLALLLSDRMGVDVASPASTPRPEALIVRENIRAKLAIEGTPTSR